MKWNKYRLKTTTAAVDFISCMMDEIGIEGIEIEDNVPLSQKDMGKMFIDILPELPPDEGIAYVSFYLDEKQEPEEVLEQVKKGLEEIKGFVDIGEGSIEASSTEDKDWINNWKEYFKTFYIDDIVIKPTWENLEEKDKGKFLLEIDPGIAFGTGKHETTRLCIRQLRKYLKKNDVVLDVGCGSGILSVLSLKLGAKDAVGIDIDPDAVAASVENARVNGIDMEHYEVFDGNIIEDEEIQKRTGYGKYDVVVANILADVIIPLSKEIGCHLKKGGIFITSGIIDVKEKEVKEAILNNGFEILEIVRDKDWVSITARK